jgi:hypothetical protein
MDDETYRELTEKLQSALQRLINQRSLTLQRKGQVVQLATSNTKSAGAVAQEQKRAQEALEERLRQEEEARIKSEREYLKGMHDWLQKITDDLYEAVSPSFSRRGTIDIVKKKYRLAEGRTPTDWVPYRRIPTAVEEVYNWVTNDDEEGY